MTRPAKTVMYDLVRIHEEAGVKYSFIHRDEWGAVIRELMDLDDEPYAKALDVHRTLARIATIEIPLVRR